MIEPASGAWLRRIPRTFVQIDFWRGMKQRGGFDVTINDVLRWRAALEKHEGRREAPVIEHISTDGVQFSAFEKRTVTRGGFCT